MYSRLLRDRVVLSCLLFVLLLSSSVLAQNPWVQSFAPLRTFYVSPNGNGAGTESDPMSLSAAVGNSQPGDLYWLTPGTYNGQIVLNRAGTPTNPIVFRAQPGLAVILNGRIDITAGDNWVWGLEIKDPNGVGTSGGLELHSSGGHAINNIIHDIKGHIGIGAWNNGPRQVVYGNIVYKQIPNGNNPHNLYTQNDIDTNGFKYIVGNMFLDSWDATDSSYNVHGYTEGNSITGFHFQNNILRHGRFLIGGRNLPSDRSVVQNNYYYDAPIIFGWMRPSQVHFLNNYVAKSMLTTLYFWGAGENYYPQPENNIYTGNTFLFPSGPHVDFRTSAYFNSPPADPIRSDGIPTIRTGDVFDNNTYSSSFNGNFFANGVDQGNVNLATWRSLTAAAGKAFDTNSTEISGTPPNNIVVIPNEYEPGRGHLAIYNWNLSATVNVNLSSIVSIGAAFEVLDPRNMGSPILTGVYSGPVDIPTGNAEFLALLVVASGAAPPPPPPSSYSQYVESESAALITPMQSKKSSDASDRKYVYSSNQDQGTATFNVWVPEDNNYVVWAHVLAPSATEDSFHVSADGGAEDTYDVAENTWSDQWQWTMVNGRGGSGVPLTINPRTFNLTTGYHSIVFRGAEPNTKVDVIAITNDPSFVPSGNLVVYKVKCKKVKSDSATIKWRTAVMTNAQVEWGTTPDYGNLTPLDVSMDTKHSVSLLNLLPGITYHFRVRSVDSGANTSVSADYTLTTPLQ